MQAPRVRLREDIIRRVQGEFLEMPGLRLTEPQARRLWALEPSLCNAVLTELVENGFLLQTRDGAFVRVDVASPLKAGRHGAHKKTLGGLTARGGGQTCRSSQLRDAIEERCSIASHAASAPPSFPILAATLAADEA